MISITSNLPEILVNVFNVDSGVMTVTINRLEKKNSITSAMYNALADLIEAAESHDMVRTLLIQGHTSIFSAGNDIADFLNNPPATTDAPVFRFLHNLSNFRKPLVAAVCGPAVGIGTTMLLHCDLVYAGDNAVFSLPFVDLGVCPEAASSLLLPQVLGYQRASAAMLLGESFSAEAALNMGLVNRILPCSEVSSFAHQQAYKLTTKPLSALIETKRLMKKTNAQPVQERMAEEATSFMYMLTQPAAREALNAFTEKRKPDFSAA